MTMRFRQRNTKVTAIQPRATNELPSPEVIDDWLRKERERRSPKPERPFIELPRERQEPHPGREERKKDNKETGVDLNI